jgi:hypothetical protein
VVVIACAWTATPAAGEEVNENQVMSAQYTGTMSLSASWPKQGGGEEEELQTASLKFAISISYSIAESETTPVHWQINELSGSVHDAGKHAGGEPYECAATLVQRPELHGEIQGGAFVPPAGYGEEPGANNFSVTPPGGVPVGSLLVQVTKEVDHDENCGEGPEGWNTDNPWSFGSQLGGTSPSTEWAAKAAPTAYFPATGSHTEAENYTFTCKPPACGPESEDNGHGEVKHGSVTNTIESSITFSSGSSEPSSPPANPPVTQPPTTPPASTTTSSSSSPTTEKREAEEQREHEKEEAEDWSDRFVEMIVDTEAEIHQAIVISELKNGARGEPDADVTVPSYLVQAQISEEEALREEHKIAADPAAPEYESLAFPGKAKAATLPACKLHRRGLSYCKKLRSAESAQLADGATALALEGALYSTISRETGAIDAADFAAASVQRTHFATLRAEYKTAVTEGEKAGGDVAALLRAKHVKGVISKRADAAAITAVKAKLAKDGVSAATVTAHSPAIFTPSKFDFLTALGHLLA